VTSSAKAKSRRATRNWNEHTLTVAQPGGRGCVVLGGGVIISRTATKGAGRRFLAAVSQAGRPGAPRRQSEDGASPSTLAGAAPTTLEYLLAPTALMALTAK
jgi:hypothetical protein